jgi:hypothetical protein
MKKVLFMMVAISGWSWGQTCQITSPLPVPVTISGCTYSGSLPSNSTSYIQNTLSPTTTSQQFSVQDASATHSETLGFISGTQCLHSVNGSISGTGSDCGSGGGGGSSTLAVGTGTTGGFTGPIISSPTAIILFSSSVFTSQLIGSATNFININFSSVTAQGPVVSSITLVSMYGSPTFTGITASSVTVAGAGNGQITLTISGSTYTAISSSGSYSVGQYALFSSTNGTVIGGTPAGGGSPSGPNYSIQVDSNGAFGGSSNFQSNGTTTTLSSVNLTQFTNIDSVTISNGGALFTLGQSTLTVSSGVITNLTVGTCIGCGGAGSVYAQPNGIMYGTSSSTPTTNAGVISWDNANSVMSIGGGVASENVNSWLTVGAGGVGGVAGDININGYGPLWGGIYNLYQPMEYFVQNSSLTVGLGIGNSAQAFSGFGCRTGRPRTFFFWLRMK